MERKIKEWLRMRSQDMEFVNCLSDIVENPRVEFKVGDKVVYTNNYGISFHDCTIIAISKDDEMWKYGRCIFIDTDCFWVPKHPKNLSFNKTNRKILKNIKCLKFVCIDFWGNRVYKDSLGRIWKDISLDAENPQLYSVCANDIDGEPCMPITYTYPNFYKDL